MDALNCDFTFAFHPRQRERFRQRDLVREWRTRYPQIFDADDERVLSTEPQIQYHFVEWLAAVLLFEATGYLSLVEGYTAGTHPEKLKKLQGCLKPAVFDWVKSSESGQPDLFVYTPGTDDWFFCEIKGPRDKLRENQLKWRADFESALATMNIPIKGRYRVLCLKELNGPVREGT